MALRRTVLGHQPEDGYRVACGFFGTALFDRSGTLKTGLPLKVLPEIPLDGRGHGTIGDLCDARGEELVAEARKLGNPIRLFWSGGIDSTAACVAILKALGDDTETLEICFSTASVGEYRKFHRLIKKRGIERLRVNYISEGFKDGPLLVTGEHGDQIFGSMLVEGIQPFEYHAQWRVPILRLMSERLGKKQARKALSYLEPQIAACPIPIKTAFEVLWWWNFSMKWQSVSLRMLAPLDSEESRGLYPALRHFFDTDDFQRWSLANPDKRIRDTWQSYKWPLKDYIFEFTKDARYRDRKLKERSLREVFHGQSRRPFAIDASGRKLTQPFDPSLRAEDGRGAALCYETSGE